MESIAAGEQITGKLDSIRLIHGETRVTVSTLVKRKRTVCAWKDSHTLLCFSHSMCLTFTELAGFNFLSAATPASLQQQVHDQGVLRRCLQRSQNVARLAPYQLLPRCLRSSTLASLALALGHASPWHLTLAPHLSTSQIVQSVRTRSAKPSHARYANALRS